MGDGEFAFGILTIFVDFLADDIVTEVHALVTDKNRRARDQFSDLVLTFAAKRAVKQLFIFILGSFVTHTKLPKSSVQ
jgi:hypothetical protein